ncbi:hypothetical protein ACL90Y_02470 [Micrococcus luteus]
MAEQSKPLDPVLLKKREGVWKQVGGSIASEAPKLVRKFVGKNPAKRLLGHPQEPWHQAVVFALSDQPQALIRVMQGATLRVAADYPESTRYLYEGAQVFRWCSLRLGLLGWAEVWDVPVVGEKRPGPPYSLGDRQRTRYLSPESDDGFQREFGTIEAKSGFRATPTMEAGAVNRMAEALERSVIGLRDPEMNDVGLSEERLLELIDFYARMIRMWMGLPQEQPAPEPDFSVDLPAEFQGFGPQVR